MKYFLTLALVSLFFAGWTSPTKAQMACYVDPVYEYTGTGTISSAVFLRDGACSQGTTILSTLSAGTVVEVMGFTDGWYRVAVNGGRGWVGSQFVNNSARQAGNVWDSYITYMSVLPSVKPGAATTPPATTVTPTPTTVAVDPVLVNRFRGYILLQVQAHGEAWYLNPTDGKRYYMKDGPTAYQMMRSFGQGIFDADYAKMAAGNVALKNKFRGRIVLRVQAHGEAYYIYPKELSMHYLKDGDEAYRLMRYYGQGISNADLAKIPEGVMTLK